jgi:hypothetical protein
MVLDLKGLATIGARPLYLYTTQHSTSEPSLVRLIPLRVSNTSICRWLHLLLGFQLFGEESSATAQLSESLNTSGLLSAGWVEGWLNLFFLFLSHHNPLWSTVQGALSFISGLSFFACDYESPLKGKSRPRDSDTSQKASRTRFISLPNFPRALSHVTRLTMMNLYINGRSGLYNLDMTIYTLKILIDLTSPSLSTSSSRCPFLANCHLKILLGKNDCRLYRVGTMYT